LKLSIPCATIKITNKHVLKKAAKQLRVAIHGYNFTSLGDEDITASITMDIPPHKGNPSMEKYEFYGEWTPFRSVAKESACLAALTYLKNEGLIVVHDTNFIELKETKKKLQAEKFWSDELYDRVISLREQLGTKVTTSIPTNRSSVSRLPHANCPQFFKT
jgi:hypothetical protein